MTKESHEQWANEAGEDNTDYAELVWTLKGMKEGAEILLDTAKETFTEDFSFQCNFEAHKVTQAIEILLGKIEDKLQDARSHIDED